VDNLGAGLGQFLGAFAASMRCATSSNSRISSMVSSMPRMIRSASLLRHPSVAFASAGIVPPRLGCCTAAAQSDFSAKRLSTVVVVRGDKPSIRRGVQRGVCSRSRLGTRRRRSMAAVDHFQPLGIVVAQPNPATSVLPDRRLERQSMARVGTSINRGVPRRGLPKTNTVERGISRPDDRAAAAWSSRVKMINPRSSSAASRRSSVSSAE
jgi:hypothetical protein